MHRKRAVMMDDIHGSGDNILLRINENCNKHRTLAAILLETTCIVSKTVRTTLITHAATADADQR